MNKNQSSITRKALGALTASFVTLLISAGMANATKCEVADKRLAGAYELTDVFETGSIIYLLPDGRFGYELSVGAYDEVARGCWKRNGSGITLMVNEMRVNHGNEKFKQLNLKLRSGNKLIRDHQGKKWGTYERVTRF